MKTTQTISRKDLSVLYGNCCEKWQLIIGKHLAEQYDAKEIEVSSTLVKQAYSEADKAQKTMLEKYFDFTSTRPSTIEALCKVLGIKEKDLYLFPADTKDKHERFLNACNILPKIHAIYNDDVVLNWKDTNQYKYAPYRNFDGGGRVGVLSWCCALSYSVGFYLKDKETAQASYDNFPALWADYWGV